jgi:hypothetical protein
VLSEQEVWRLLHDASDVLDYLHGRAPPIIHRDLKPGNVIRRPDGSFAFVDFGAVRDKLRPKGGSTVVGTFGYMAPEQVQGRALPASDVYAIGATAIAMLTGCEPEELPHRGLGVDVARTLRGRDARLIRALERMLEPDPERRASRIAPLLANRPNGKPRSSRGDGREAIDEGRADRYGRHAARRARRAARRAERAAHRAAHRRGLAHHSYRLSWPVRLLLVLLFTAGIVAVSIATQVVVPVVLRVLSLFVARRSLVAAADATRRGGDAAIDGMRAARRWVFGEAGPLSEMPEPRVRVDPGAAQANGEKAAVEEEVETIEEAELGASTRGPTQRR